MSLTISCTVKVQWDCVAQVSSNISRSFHHLLGACSGVMLPSLRKGATWILSSNLCPLYFALLYYFSKSYMCSLYISPSDSEAPLSPFFLKTEDVMLSQLHFTFSAPALSNMKGLLVSWFVSVSFLQYRGRNWM